MQELWFHNCSSLLTNKALQIYDLGRHLDTAKLLLKAKTRWALYLKIIYHKHKFHVHTQSISVIQFEFTGGNL